MVIMVIGNTGKRMWYMVTYLIIDNNGSRYHNDNILHYNILRADQGNKRFIQTKIRTYNILVITITKSLIQIS